MDYRPWGQLDWALGLSKPRQWDFVGALGTEERSLAAWHWLKVLGGVSTTLMLEVLDRPSRHTARATKLILKRAQKFLADGGVETEIKRGLELMTENHRIMAIAQTIEQSASESVMLDITSLPKRFFFPLLRYLEQSSRVRDLVITYTSPAQYLEEDVLSEDATDWLTLPGFPEQGGQTEMLIVSVGFMVESLRSHLTSINKHESVKMLIPFPAPLSILRRTWDSVCSLESKSEPGKFQNFRIEPSDLAGAFQRISQLASEAKMKPTFAPFGPKPLSAAMCLYASRHRCPVYYPQPRVYHPDYSQGVREVDGKPAVIAYWIKHESTKLYGI
jgi:hypothetical protein